MRKVETTEETNRRIAEHRRKVLDDIKNDPSEKAKLVWAKLERENEV